MRLLRYLLLAACLVAIATPARAFVPQTIVIDGTNDFDPSNLLDDDRTDTQSGCAVGVYPMDLGRVYVTNDNNYLYLGIEFSRTCYCDMNLGLAIDVNSAAGGATDPFGRKIGWANVPFKPDWVVYDVVPTNCNSFNYEILYGWNTGTSAWVNQSTLVNPSWGSGSNGLGIGDGNDFKEVRLPLSVLGAGVGTPLHLELWITQEGATKGPLDALCSDNVQMSRGSSTTYDTTAVVEMTCMLNYTVLNAVDNTAPVVSQANAVNFIAPTKTLIVPGTNRVDVVFSEPVDLATAQTTTNYAYSGPSARTVISATRDAAALNIVHLQLNAAISASAQFHNITVSGVKDVALNTIAANGSTNVGSFFIQNVVFNANLRLQFCNGVFTAADSFAVEGNLAPLSFALCDAPQMTDANADTIYTTTVPFAMPKDPISGLATADLEWKLTRNCAEYESFPGNRTYTLSNVNGASVTLNVAWNNDDPANFTSGPVQVTFQVNAASFHPTGANVITLLGSQGPLSFAQPGVPMLDNGVAPDAVAGDKVYTARVTFPKCTFRTVSWKVDFDGVIECLGQGDRSFTISPANEVAGAIVLPARGIDRCTVTDKPVTVVFKVDMTTATPDPVPGNQVAVMGNVAPLQFALPPAAGQFMADDGVAPDAAAGDHVFTRAVTFPDSTPMNVEFKFWFDQFVPNSGFECEGQGNRQIALDDLVYSTGTPYVLLHSQWDACLQPVDVPGGEARSAGASFAELRPSFPVPFAGRTTVSFELRRAGRVTLHVYDVSGRRVATLIDRELAPGHQTVVWDGRDSGGGRLRSGVYLAVLSMGRDRLTNRLVLAR